MADARIFGFSRRWAGRIVRAVKLVEGFRMTGAVRFHKGADGMSAYIPGTPGGGGGTTFHRMRVLEEFNDYLRCRRVDEAGSVGTEDVYVAKPPMLRHDAAYYANVGTIETIDESTVTATENTASNPRIEKWQVRPPYTKSPPAPEILAIQTGMAAAVEVEIEGDNQPLTLMDSNGADSRGWALIEVVDEGE